jgi:hypothetical protein
VVVVVVVRCGAAVGWCGVGVGVGVKEGERGREDII